MTTLRADGTTTCCNAYSKYYDSTECCRACFNEITTWENSDMSKPAAIINLAPTTPPVPRVTLKNVKHAKFASEETNCFSADVYFDGQYAGTARNDGHGGCNMWDYGKKAPGWTPLVEYAASLPAETDPDFPMIDGKPFSMQPDPDYVVDNALEAWLDDRELTRLLSSRVTFIDEDGKLRSTTPKRPAATIAAWLGPQLDKTLASLKTTADKVLNLMPRDAALAAYRRHG